MHHKVLAETLNTTEIKSGLKFVAMYHGFPYRKIIYDCPVSP
jgi:hypothetical protein